MEIPVWQMSEVRGRVKEINEDPSILINEVVVFQLLSSNDEIV